jgi:hypothetical protein
MWVVTEGRRAYAKRTKSKNKSPAAVQLSLSFRERGRLFEKEKSKSQTINNQYIKNKKSAFQKLVGQ